MMMTAPTPQQIAAAVLADKGQGRALPTDLLALARSIRNLEIECVRTNAKFEGRLELCQNTPTIYINLRDQTIAHPRTRFTLGHEFGHFFLHRGLLRRGQSIHDSAITFEEDLPQIEREANEFASELLLPPHLVRDFLAKNILTLERVDELSRLANASLQATAIKVAGISSSMSCFFWERDGAIAWPAPSRAWQTAKHPYSSWKGRLPGSSHAATTSESFDLREVERTVWHPNSRSHSPLFEAALSTPYGRLILVVDPSTDAFIEA